MHASIDESDVEIRGRRLRDMMLIFKKSDINMSGF